MEAKLGQARRLFWFDGAGQAVDLAKLSGTIRDGATVLKTLAWSQNPVIGNLFTAEPVSIDKAGNFQLRIVYDGATKDTFSYDVGTYPLTDYQHNVALNPYLPGTLAGTPSLVIKLRVVDPDNSTSGYITTAWDAASASYVAQQTYTFAKQGAYALVWFRQVNGVDSPWIWQDAVVLKRDGKETVKFSARSQDEPAGSPHVGATVVVSKADGTNVAQGITGDDGKVVLNVDPGTYTVALVKAGVTFSVNNFKAVVVDTDIAAWTGVVPLTSGSFTHTVTATPNLPSRCLLTATLRDMRGRPLPHAHVDVTVLSRPQLLSGTVVSDTRRTWKTDSNGYVEFEIVQGLKVEVSVAPLGLRRIITVPASAGPQDLFVLLASAPDPFDVEVPVIPAAPRRTL